ncbi:3029_t:CDS:2 [Paraglomus brasilianum]|uniref:3029_t:CDS:1 n=1 Tax=Paraglomus brasilianum TaxID=144538 RepID=A0A9N9FMR1_9GLOM|nr:3029_t:CDS:2 [Paraglomus brasilianum]
MQREKYKMEEAVFGVDENIEQFPNAEISSKKIKLNMIIDMGLEFSTLEVSGSPSKLDHTHYVGDQNKTAKMLKIKIIYISNTQATSKNLGG